MMCIIDDLRRSLPALLWKQDWRELKDSLFSVAWRGVAWRGVVLRVGGDNNSMNRKEQKKERKGKTTR